MYRDESDTKKFNYLCSKLYSIEPIGIKTEYIESLTSYIIRIAEAHSVFVGTLLNKELAQVLNKKYISEYAVNGGNGFFDWAYTVNGTYKNAYDFAEALSFLTSRDDILSMTLLSWKEVLPVRGLLNETLSWCPECFCDWREKGLPIYTPLIWHFKIVEVCSKHKTRLVNVCPSCSRKVPVLHRKSCNGFCPNCRNWLGRGSSVISTIKIEKPEWHEWINKNVGDIVSCSYNLSDIPQRDQVGRMINQLINKTTGNLTEFSRLTGIPKTTLCDWSKGKAIPTIDKILILAYKFNVTLMEIFLMSDVRNEQIEYRQIEYFSPDRRSSGNRKINPDDIKYKLEQFLVDDLPLSMAEVAKKTGINKRTLYRLFSNLCKQIAERNRQYNNLKSKERRGSIIEKVEVGIEKLIISGIYPSRRKVEAALPKFIIVKDNNIRKVWKDKLSQ